MTAQGNTLGFDLFNEIRAVGTLRYHTRLNGLSL